MKLSIFILTTLVSFSTLAADIKFPVSEIPEELQKDMYAVVRERDTKFTINSTTSSRLSIRMVVTILKSEGKSMSDCQVYYDKMKKIDSFKGAVYDASGKLIKKLKSSEVSDVSAISDISLFEDGRVKYADLGQAIYPYTVEYEYVVDMNYLYDAPDYYLITDDEVAIQRSTYSVVYPLDLKPRFKLIKIGAPTISMQDEKHEMSVWSFQNVRPDKFEAYRPDNSIPSILVSPNEFVFGGYAGKLSSWEAYGQWQAALNNGRDILPDATVTKVKELTKSLTTIEDKSRVLYEYLQSKTRYVSIQLGIGGFQPFEAKIVDQTGYGDCKALSNYMVALLKSAGVKSYYATIMAGANANSVLADFPSDQSNHIIVAVPNVKDTLWLECTNQTNPFAYIGRFTCERKAMLVTETGGKLVNTPRYDANQNLQVTKALVDLTSAGDATARVSTTSFGLQYDDVYADGQKDDQKKWLQKNTDIPNFDIKAFNIINNKSKAPSAVVDIDLVLRRYASISGKRLFLTPNLMNKSRSIPAKLEKRKSNVFIRSAYVDVDTIIYKLPEGIYPEFMPAAVKLKSRFGEYEANFIMEQDKLVYVRRIKVNKGEFPAETYNEFVEFYKNLAKADNTKMVFLSKT